MKLSDKNTNFPISEIYNKVLELFKDKSRFAQGYYSYDKEHNQCYWNNRNAYSYCVLGAIYVVSQGYGERAQSCLQRVSKHLFGKHIRIVNDESDGYDKVIMALKFAHDLWKEHEPTDEDLTTPVSVILERRNG